VRLRKPKLVTAQHIENPLFATGEVNATQMS
jgi:hypothetical protein